MGREELQGALELAFEESPALREELGGEVERSKEEKKKRGNGKEKEARRCLAACLRAAAFLSVGDSEQALKVRFFLLNAEKREKETGASAHS